MYFLASLPALSMSVFLRFNRIRYLLSEYTLKYHDESHMSVRESTNMRHPAISSLSISVYSEYNERRCIGEWIICRFKVSRALIECARISSWIKKSYGVKWLQKTFDKIVKRIFKVHQAVVNFTRIAWRLTTNIGKSMECRHWSWIRRCAAMRKSGPK